MFRGSDDAEKKLPSHWHGLRRMGSSRRSVPGVKADNRGNTKVDTASSPQGGTDVAEQTATQGRGKFDAGLRQAALHKNTARWARKEERVGRRCSVSAVRRAEARC